jgi:anti-sigma factor RsiW
MNHSKVRARLNDYLERDLPPKERSRVTAHLAECPECAEELRELEGTVTLLRRLPEAKVPPALAASVMARVRAGEVEPGGLLRWLRPLATPAFAVPLAAGLAGLVLFAGLRDEPLQQPGAESQPAARIAVNEPPAEPAPRPVRLEPRPEQRIELVRAMQRRSLLQELARRGHAKEVALTLRGAGHPLASSMASHFDDHDPEHVALATWSPGK